MIKKKVCLIGSYAVGKTSLVRQFVDGIFSDEYLTTVGVKIDQKKVAAEGREIRMMVWDIAGRDEVQQVQKSYLLGASGFLFVADGTRRETVDGVLEEIDTIEADYEGAARCLLLLNKADLQSDWEVEEATIAELRERFPVMMTSARTGENVEKAFMDLAVQMVEGAGKELSE